jgi:DNA-binding NtrC family response regulator
MTSSSSSSSSSSTTTTTNRNNKSILAVDDENAIVDIIKQSLQRQEFKVCIFTDPFAALAHFKSDYEDYHHIVLSDIRMPGMNGYEFVRKVKENDPKVKVILMSAFEINDKEFHNLLPHFKVDAFLQKPFSIQQLNDVVQKIGRD